MHAEFFFRMLITTKHMRVDTVGGSEILHQLIDR